MRIIGDIPHPFLKITVFKNEGKLSLKCEAGLLEQIYKFRDDERLQTFEDIQKIVDEAFIKKMESLVSDMAIAKNDAMLRNLTLPEADEFDVIL
jgi:hypothetical protein